MKSIMEVGPCLDCGRNVYDESVKADCRALGLPLTWISAFQCWPCHEQKKRLKKDEPLKFTIEKVWLTREEVEALFG